ncbi:MAG: hypothetical protein H7X70_06990 [Candidatus Kapabacteria bacterium]|nr:hypothetical protein [Candidatus Kapabacteria bacterium]
MIVALFATFSLAAQPKHDLKLGRSIKAFDQYLLKTNYESQTHTQLFVNDELRGDSVEKFNVILSAQCSVVSVTVDGQEKEKRLVIRDFRRLTDRDTIDLLPTGTKIRCWFSDSGSIYTINDEPTPDAISQILVEVVKGEGGARTGNVLDAKKPVAVGSTWKMNIPAFRKMLGKEMSNLMKKLTGTVTFKSIDSLPQQPTATIVARAEAPKFSLKFGDMPSSASLIADFTIVVPLDVRFPALSIATSTVQRITTKQGIARMELAISSKRTSLFLR